MLTKDTIAAAYDLLAITPPFNKWNLPDSDDVQFKVARDPHSYGWCNAWGRGKRREYLIAISSRKVEHLSSLLSTMAHEIIHLHLYMTGQDTNGEHNAAFSALAKKVCRLHGFDSKAFL